MLKTRVLSACVFVPVILVCGFFGSWLFSAMMLFIAIVGGNEYGKLIEAQGASFQKYIYYGSCLLMILGAQLMAEASGILSGILFLSFLALGWLVIAKKMDFQDAAQNILGIVYLPVMLSTAVLLRNGYADGMWLFYLLLILEWFTDTGAYFIGTKFGKHKLMPKVSPKKSVEGFFGGLAVAVIGAVVLNIFTDLMPVWLMIITAVLVSIAGQIGDLFESALKRRAGVKDSGTLIPGHGGILDRFDSMLFAAPLLYLIYGIYVYVIML